MKEQEINEMKIAIIGHGMVGKGLHALFKYAKIYTRHFGTKKTINKQDIAFVAIPTHTPDYCDFDLKPLYELFKWLETPLICIKSTVPVGTCRYISRTFGKKVVFSPEFLRDKTPIEDTLNEHRIIAGGRPEETEKIIKLYQSVYGADLQYFSTDWETAELVKYVNNCFLATKVIFCNEVYEISQALGVDYNELRELWLLEKRVTSSHTLVTKQRGFGGKCFPKDLEGMINMSEEAGYSPRLLCKVREKNKKMRKGGYAE